MSMSRGSESTAKLTKRERLRKAALKSAGAVAVVAALGAGLTGASKGHSGPKHNKATEAGIEKVIEPEMTKIALAAQELADKPGGVIFSRQIGETVDQSTGQKTGITEISGLSTRANNWIDVVMKDYAGTNKPNPNDVLAVNMVADTSSVGVDSNHGTTITEEATFIVPGSSQYLKTLSANPYPIDKEGWSAIDSWSTNVDGVYQLKQSGALDTASAEFYGHDPDTYQDVGPLGTAQQTVSHAEDILHVVNEDLSHS